MATVKNRAHRAREAAKSPAQRDAELRRARAALLLVEQTAERTHYGWRITEAAQGGLVTMLGRVGVTRLSRDTGCSIPTLDRLFCTVRLARQRGPLRRIAAYAAALAIPGGGDA